MMFLSWQGKVDGADTLTVTASVEKRVALARRVRAYVDDKARGCHVKRANNDVMAKVG